MRPRRATRRRAIAMAVAGGLLLGIACRREPTAATFALQSGDTWIQDVTVVSAEREAPLAHAHVILRDGRIASVAATPPRAGAENVAVLAGAGKYLTPGLIDSHVHLAGVPGMTPEHEAALPKLVEAYYQQLPRSYLYFGFTAVVDLHVLFREPLERMRATALAPAVFDCGGALPIANGYPMMYIPPSVRFELSPNFLYDPRQADRIPARFTPEQHSPDAAVGRVAAGGGRCVKTFYEPGFGAFAGKLPVPSVEQIRGVREASRQRGLPLLLHANSVPAYRFAVEVQPDVIVHGLWN